MRVLELTKSPYYTAFSSLVKEVSVAHAEATDNVKFLAPLIKYFRDLHELDDHSLATGFVQGGAGLDKTEAWTHELRWSTGRAKQKERPVRVRARNSGSRKAAVGAPGRGKARSSSSANTSRAARRGAAPMLPSGERSPSYGELRLD